MKEPPLLASPASSRNSKNSFFGLGPSDIDIWPLAVKWMQGQSLKELIVDKIRYEQENDNTFDGARDRDKVNDLIRGLFEDIEKELRYTYVKYVRLYSDVLRAVLIE